MKHICELKEDYESRTGKKLVVTYVEREVSHEEVEKRFAKALHIPFWKRAKWFLENLTFSNKRSKP
jgi:hypothetical protein